MRLRTRSIPPGQVRVLVAVTAVVLGGALAGWRIHSGHHATPAPPGALAPSGESAGAADLSPTTTATAPPTAQSMLAELPPNQRAVAYAKVPSVPIYPSPGSAPDQSLANPNRLGAPLVFLVVGAQENWLQVMLPERPNGATGWVRRADVRIYQDDYLVVVHLGTYRLDLYKDGNQVETFPVAVGSRYSPTPTGSFYVTELLAPSDPNGAYGPDAFGLSDFSNTYTEFDGGPGQVAIHGTDEPWVIGTAASHGCVRLNNAAVSQLAGVLPVGTPVQIEQ